MLRRFALPSAMTSIAPFAMCGVRRRLISIGAKIRELYLLNLQRNWVEDQWEAYFHRPEDTRVASDEPSTKPGGGFETGWLLEPESSDVEAQGCDGYELYRLRKVISRVECDSGSVSRRPGTASLMYDISVGAKSPVYVHMQPHQDDEAGSASILHRRQQ